MTFSKSMAVAFAAALAVAGCAQQEEPVAPEPIYSPPVFDKLGNQVAGGGMCRPASRPVLSTTSPQLEPCEDICTNGYTQASTGAFMCLPPDDGGCDEDGIVAGTAAPLECPPPREREPERESRDLNGGRDLGTGSGTGGRTGDRTTRR